MTAFPGNTLEGWLQLLFLPLAVPAILLPAARAQGGGKDQ
jgi:hypothetical protein